MSEKTKKVWRKVKNYVEVLVGLICIVLLILVTLALILIGSVIGLYVMTIIFDFFSKMTILQKIILYFTFDLFLQFLLQCIRSITF